MIMIRSSRILLSRTATRGAARMFSGECEAAQRFRDVLAEYRKENYSRELPTRFRKEVLQPYIGNDGSVDIDQLNQLLTNIGHPQDCLSPSEQQEFLKAAGSSNRCITVKKMEELMP